MSALALSSAAAAERVFSTGERARIGTWVFLVSEAMFFGGLIAAWIVLRGSDPAWPSGRERLAIAPTLAATLALVSSSFTAHRGASAAARARHAAAKRWLGLTLLLGALFLAIQATEWRALISAGRSPAEDLFWSCFFVLTGCHGAHVLGGLLWALVAWFDVARSVPSGRPSRRAGLFALYWHFVDLVWLVLFVLLYLS